MAGELVRPFDLADIATFRSGHRRPFCQSRHFPSRSAGRAHSFAVPCDAVDRHSHMLGQGWRDGLVSDHQQQREGRGLSREMSGAEKPFRFEIIAPRGPQSGMHRHRGIRPFGPRNLKLDWIRAVHLPERKRQHVCPEPVEATLSRSPSAGASLLLEPSVGG